MGEEEEENHRSLGVERQVVLKRGFSQHDTQRKEQFVWCLNTLVGQACSVWGDPRPSTWPLSQAPARVPTAGFCSLGTPIVGESEESAAQGWERVAGRSGASEPPCMASEVDVHLGSASSVSCPQFLL